MAKEVVHMVWFKYPSLTDEQLQIAIDACKKLTEIPGVISAEIGKNFTNRSEGYNYGLMVRLESKESLDLYAPHPIHEEFKSAIQDFRGDSLAMDFEVSP